MSQDNHRTSAEFEDSALEAIYNRIPKDKILSDFSTLLHINPKYHKEVKPASEREKYQDLITYVQS